MPFGPVWVPPVCARPDLSGVHPSIIGLTGRCRRSPERKKTPALDPDRMRQLFASFDLKKPVDLPDLALIWCDGVHIRTSCGRLPADPGRLHRARPEQFPVARRQGGVEREVPCHPACAEYLDAWMQAAAIAGSAPLSQAPWGADTWPQITACIREILSLARNSTPMPT